MFPNILTYKKYLKIFSEINSELANVYRKEVQTYGKIVKQEHLSLQR